MPKSLDRTGRGAVGALAALVLSAALTSATAAAPRGPGESARIPFAERFHTTGHGGIARITQTVVACRPAARGPAAAAGPSCSAPRRTDRARLRLPAGSRVRYARLYWAATCEAAGPRRPGTPGRCCSPGPGPLRGGARGGPPRAPQHPPDRRLPGVRRRHAAGAAGRRGPVRGGPAGPGHRRARGTGRAGWALVVAYENPREPLRRLALWDGFEPLGGRRRAFAVELAGLHLPARAHGRVGVVDYHGTRQHRRTLSAQAGRITPVALHDSVDQPNGTKNSAGRNSGRRASGASVNRSNRGFTSEVLDLTPALRSGGDRLTFRFTTRKAGYLLGALFVQADLRR
ncbi:hypothetical protein [Streptomyces noursei]|uniref:hypothetical protein n=1 Tax=Streptomyces noursei TaxID=1971 RepID=UPI00045EF717|nr:hypothetical protein [Streptomyces noursei]AIA03770.1 hypothetical protein DC74_3272 [Streptomyces noursei]